MLSQKEMFEFQIAQEKDELERYPKEEAEELARVIYQGCYDGITRVLAAE